MAFAKFEDIVELIDSTEPDGGGLKVFFKCRRTGRVVEARGRYPDGMRRNFATVATASTTRALLHMASGWLRRLTGIYVPLGNAVRTGELPGGSFVNEGDRQAAAIAAFETVAEYPGKPRRGGRFNHVDGQWIFVE